MNRARTLFWSALAAVILAAGSPAAMACTACFGKSDSNMAKGMNMGIAVLLLIITCVLCGVAGFFVYLARRTSHLNEPQFPHNFSPNRTNA
ncbi:MAG TPA: hypothetical protein VM735_07235 [Candidatus Kapabacteria bacterium]|nr:hypothetical protein [Candidatus Kapabacteria bacterium]